MFVKIRLHVKICISGGNLGLKLNLASRFEQQIISNVQVANPIASKKTRLISSGTNSMYRRPINVSYGNELPRWVLYRPLDKIGILALYDIC